MRMVDVFSLDEVNERREWHARRLAESDGKDASALIQGYHLSPHERNLQWTAYLKEVDRFMRGIEAWLPLIMKRDNEITSGMIEAGIRFAEDTLIGSSVGDSTIRYLVAGILERAMAAHKNQPGISLNVSRHHHANGQAIEDAEIVDQPSPNGTT